MAGPATLPAMSFETRFYAYLGSLHDVLGDKRRRGRFDSYCTGLNLSLERKSVEPMAAALEPDNVAAAHQNLQHFVADAPWSDDALLGRIESLVDEAMGDAPRYWLVDDTGMPKKGRHSVGVARQYCGQIGKQDNCQVAVSVSLATEAASVPVAYRLYLPESWATDPDRRAAVGVPEDVAFRTKAQIALEQITDRVERGTTPGLVVADSGYGYDVGFREGLDALGLIYSVGVKANTSVWAPGVEPLPPKPYSGRGRHPKNMIVAAGHKPCSVEALARELPAQKWRTVSWREGTNAELSGRFARVRVRAASRDHQRTERRPEQWLLIEWPANEPEPTKFFLSTEAASTTLAELVATAKIRWRIERDYQEMKSEFGLNHYEGRGWRGFHHHASLCIATYAFTVIERLRHPARKKNPPRPAPPAVPEGFRPRGAAEADAASRA